MTSEHMKRSILLGFDFQIESVFQLNSDSPVWEKVRLNDFLLLVLGLDTLDGKLFCYLLANK